MGGGDEAEGRTLSELQKCGSFGLPAQIAVSYSNRERTDC
jgi:hypothetical protein